MRVCHLHGFLLTIQSDRIERTQSLSPLSVSLSWAWVTAKLGPIVLDGEAQGRQHMPAAVGRSLALGSPLLYAGRHRQDCTAPVYKGTALRLWLVLETETDEAGLLYSFHSGWPNTGRKFIWDQLMSIEFCTEFWSQSSNYYNWHFVLDYISGTSKRERGSSGQ